MPFPFTAGEFPTAANLNSALQLGDQTETIAFTPAGNTDYSTAAWGDWITLGNVTVPTWATTAIVSMAATGYFEVTGVPNVFQLRSKLGTAVATVDVIAGSASAVSTRTCNVTWASTLTSIPTGSQSLRIQANRNTGGGTLRADTISRFAALVIYTT